MRRIGFWSLLLTALVAPANLGGCPEGSNLLDQLGINSDQLQSLLSDEDVFKVLGEVVEAELADEGSSSGEPIEPSDEQPFFGEDQALFDEAGETIDVEVSEDSAVGDVAPDGGAVAHGTLVGMFINDIDNSDSTRSGGLFRGVWADSAGNKLGVVRGEYQPVSPDELPDGLIGGGVFWGKYIGSDGKFRGILRGRYGHVADGQARFVGRWLDAKLRRIGVIKGHWRDEAASDGGTFNGRWAAYNLCNEVDAIALNETGDSISGDEVALLSAAAAGSMLDGSASGAATADPAAQASDSPCIDLNGVHGFLVGVWMPGLGDPSQAGSGRRGRTYDDGLISGEWRDADNVRVGTFSGFYEVFADHAAGEGHDDESASDLPGDNSGSNDSGDEVDGGSDALDDDDSSDDEDDDRPRRRIEGAFIGKVVSDSGEVLGYIRGLYGKSVNNVGIFRGHYLNAEGRVRGKLGGRWAASPDSDSGTMTGMWGALRPRLNSPPAADDDHNDDNGSDNDDRDRP